MIAKIVDCIRGIPFASRSKPEPRPFSLQRNGRVFYCYLDEEAPGFDEVDAYIGALVRDEDFRLEDACWPCTPPGFRIIFETMEMADGLVAATPSCSHSTFADNDFMNANPEDRLPGW